MKPVLLIDFGSTYTKLTAVDVDAEVILGTAASYTTIETDISDGLTKGLKLLEEKTGKLDYAETYACSSAAGGLRMIASGLVPELTSEAAKLASLGAGAKIIGLYSFQLTEDDLQEIQEINIRMEQEVHDARIKFMTISDKDQEFLDKMEKVIEKNFSNPELSGDYLASELGISRSGLFSKIKALTDVTPNEMIQVIRLKHAASLLLSESYRVNEVCYMVGFSSPSYFAKCFQKQYGCTPAKYKG